VNEIKRKLVSRHIRHVSTSSLNSTTKACTKLSTVMITGRDFPHLFKPVLGPTKASCKMGTGAFPGIKPPGHGVDHPPYLAPKLKKE